MLLVGAISNASAQAPKCAGATLTELQAYAEKVQAAVTSIATTAELKVALASEIKRFAETNLKLLTACSDAIVSQVKAPSASSASTIVIESAEYGDPECVEAPAGDQCKKHLTCDARSHLKRRCSDLAMNIRIRGVKDGKDIWVDLPQEVGTGAEKVKIAYADYSKTCQFAVDIGLCEKLDPSPDTKQKILLLKYSCSGSDGTGSGTIKAGDGAILTVGCPQPRTQ